MEAIYHISLILLALTFIGLPILLILFLVKPHLLNDRSFIKKPFSRGKIVVVTILIFFVSLVSFGGTMAATEPEYVKQERVTRQLAEEKTKKDAEDQKRKNAEEIKRREDEARKPIVKQETKVEPVAFETIEQQDGIMSKGERRTATEGADGERTIIYDVTYQAGRETSRKEAKNDITRQPTTKVIKIGTYVAPVVSPSPPPAPSVSSVYYKNCTAARAAGAAPVYVGQAGYGSHLDKDGDGIGCE